MQEYAGTAPAGRISSAIVHDLPLKISAFDAQCQLVAGMHNDRRRPNFDVDRIELTGCQLLNFIVGMPGLVWFRSIRVELPLRSP
jgi:hypothetical protein